LNPTANLGAPRGKRSEEMGENTEGSTKWENSPASGKGEEEVRQAPGQSSPRSAAPGKVPR